MHIDSLDKWADVAKQLSERGYSLFQTQFDVDDSHGFIARFCIIDGAGPRVELVTHDADIRNAIMRYRLLSK